MDSRADSAPRRKLAENFSFLAREKEIKAVWGTNFFVRGGEGGQTIRLKLSWCRECASGMRGGCGCDAERARCAFCRKKRNRYQKSVDAKFLTPKQLLPHFSSFFALCRLRYRRRLLHAKTLNRRGKTKLRLRSCCFPSPQLITRIKICISCPMQSCWTFKLIP